MPEPALRASVSPAPRAPASPTPPQLARKVAAEMVGTFALVCAGCGAIGVESLHPGALTGVGIGAVFGLVIMVMIHSVGHVSGAHFNPAVTVAFAAVGRFPWRQVVPYVVGQSLAAVVASLLLLGILGPDASPGVTAPAGDVVPALLLEVVITFLLMFVITSVATDARVEGHTAGIAIGGFVGLAALFAGPISGASMNPARSLGPALVSGRLGDLWIYVAAPVAGAVLGALGYGAVCCGGGRRDAAGCC